MNFKSEVKKEIIKQGKDKKILNLTKKMDGKSTGIKIFISF